MQGVCDLNALYDSIYSICEYSIRHKQNTIIEGIHLIPTVMERLKKKELANYINLYLYAPYSSLINCLLPKRLDSTYRHRPLIGYQDRLPYYQIFLDWWMKQIKKNNSNYINNNCEKNNPQKFNILQNREMELIKQGLFNLRDDILVRFSIGYWTVKDVSKRMSLCKLPLERSSPEACRRSIIRNISLMVRDKFLADEARRRGYHKRASVRREVSMWRDHFLFTLLKKVLRELL